MRRHRSRSETTAPRPNSEQSGQGLVEMALILPVFLLVFIGIFDAGRLIYTNAALSQAVREGARLAAAEAAWVGQTPPTSPACVSDESAISASNPGAHVCPSDVSALKSHVTDAVNRMAVSLGPITAVHLSCNQGDDGDPAPTGDWTEADAGNACHDGSNNPIGGSGELVSVRVELGYAPITPVINSIIGPVPLSGSATMIIN